MDKPVKTRVEVYAESTPNPAAMKFVASRMLLDEGNVEYLKKENADNSPLVQRIFDFDGVASVFVTSNFITVNKKADYEWFELIPLLRQYIKEYLETGENVFTGPQWQKTPDHEEIVAHSTEGLERAVRNDSNSGEIEDKIMSALDEYVKPAVEQDGGAIHFKSFNEGVVTLILKGSCSGCPSSVVTLKGGIERLLTQMIPEVKEVVAEEA